ncbi:MAG: hypothetical protein ACPHER_02645, partial [Nevskiales bacterium]
MKTKAAGPGQGQGMPCCTEREMNLVRLITAAMALLLLAACSNNGSNDDDSSRTVGRTFVIQPGPNATTEMVEAMIDAKPGDVIEFAAGYFELSSGIQISGTEDVLVKGQGMDETVLSFKNSSSQEGLLAT